MSLTGHEDERCPRCGLSVGASWDTCRECGLDLANARRIRAVNGILEQLENRDPG